MENNKQFTSNNRVMESSKNQLMTTLNQETDMHFEDSFRIYPKTAIHFFDSFEEKEYVNPLLEEEFTKQFIQHKAEHNFGLGMDSLQDSEEYLADPFNFMLEVESPAPAYSLQGCKLTFELEVLSSPRCKSADLQIIRQDHNEQEENKNQPKYTLAQCAQEPKNEVFGMTFAKNSSVKVEERKSSSSSSPISVDPVKLEKLIQCLNKTRGVNKDQIDDTIVARTVELGQQKVADSLNIPYRRYKSILNKVGIRTSAGRKVKNLQFETKLVEWAMEIKDMEKILTRKMVKDKAAELIREFIKQGEVSLRKIRLSKGWLDKFVKRHPEIKDYLTSQKGKKGQ